MCTFICIMQCPVRNTDRCLGGILSGLAGRMQLFSRGGRDIIHWTGLTGLIYSTALCTLNWPVLRIEHYVHYTLRHILIYWYFLYYNNIFVRKNIRNRPNWNNKNKYTLLLELFILDRCLNSKQFQNPGGVPRVWHMNGQTEDTPVSSRQI